MDNGKWELGIPLMVSIAVLVAGAILISAGLTVYFFSKSSDRFYNAEIVNSSDMMADTLASQIVGPLSLGDDAAIASLMVKSVSENHQMMEAMIVMDEGNEIFYDSAGNREGKKYRPEMRAPGLVYISKDIVQQKGFGFGLVVSKEKIATLIIGIKLENFLTNERVRALVTFAKSLSQNIADIIKKSDYVRVRDMMGNMVGARKNIRYAELMNADGNILFYSEFGMKPEKAQEREGTKEKSDTGLVALKVSRDKPLLIQRTAGPRGEAVLDIAVPVLREEEKLGVIRIGYSIEDFLEKQRRLKLTMAGIALGLVLAGIGLSLYTSSRIVKPIRILAAVARKVGEGDLEQEVDIRSGGRETRELGKSFKEMIAGLRERDFIKDTFGRYMTKQVADEILKNPAMAFPGGHKQDVTILFSDIREFTAFSERHPPEEVVSRLNEYITAMVDVITKYEGVVDKFIGDAIMAVWGSPVKREDDALRAVRTAIEMQQKLNALNDKWKTRGDETFGVGIGINSGEVIAGNIGDLRKMEYTVIGDNVNLASRIEGLTRNYNCPIIISDSTYERVKDFVIVKKLEAASVRGKVHAVQIYELLALK